MSNFRISFLYPWLLFIFIPAFALGFYLYFRISKRYRRTRNRVVSTVLYFIISTLSILTLAGIHFNYEIPNMETEVILLVDASYSGKDVEAQKNEFIMDAIKDSKDVCQIGVVTFGYGEPVYAVPLTTNTSSAYTQYVMAEKPDGTATDIADALTYTRDLFKNKEVAKIVVISDGLETDGKATTVVKELAAEGIEVNSVYFPSEKPQQDVQLVGVVTPDYNVNIGDTFTLKVNVRSSYEGVVKLELYDNGVFANEKNVTVLANNGVQELEIEHAISVPGLHSLQFKVSGGPTACEENNTYNAFMNIETFTKILMVERNVGESTALKTLLMEENEQFEIQTVNILTDVETMPKTVNELRKYDQVVLVNIANADMPEGFIDELYTYVNDIGGGLLTVGGNQVDENGNQVFDKGEVVANAYNREDMYGSLYQEMLPVQAIDYTPPVAVMLVIDRSGSMDMPAGASAQTKLELAKEGAKACLNALTERDYCGIMTLEEKYTEEMRIQPMTQKAKLLSAIDGIQTGGGTVFQDALAGAGRALQSVKNVERRHIILVTDGIPADGYDQYSLPIQQYVDDVNAPVTFSFVIIGEDISNSDKNDIRRAAELGKGRFYDVWDVASLPRIMREELNMKEIKAINYEPFQPKIDAHTSVVSGIEQVDIPQLHGFYGTKLKSGAEVSLKGEFVPIYAHWKYGEGTVGSFMCDLNNVWSSEFMANATGRRLIMNIINSLFPTKSIRVQDMEIVLQEGNYDLNMSVYTKLQKDEKIELEITSPNASGALTETRTITPSAEDGYSRIEFSITQPGVHRLTVKKLDAQGNVLATASMYKAFSYSEEYNMFYDAEEGETLMTDLAAGGQGKVIKDSHKIYEEIAKTLKRSYDPRIPFIITALVLFLLDIAVRKFKFKWIHEIIRDRKAKKLLMQKGI